MPAPGARPSRPPRLRTIHGEPFQPKLRSTEASPVCQGAVSFFEGLQLGTKTCVFQHHESVGFGEVGPILHVACGVEPRSRGAKGPPCKGGAVVAVRGVHPAQCHAPQCEEQQPPMGACEEGKEALHGPAVSFSSRMGLSMFFNAIAVPLATACSGSSATCTGNWSFGKSACQAREVGRPHRRGKCPSCKCPQTILAACAQVRCECLILLMLLSRAPAISE